jgi:phage/plasmid-associated DNA primase
VSRAERSAFDKGNTKIHKEIATWGGKRIVWVNEATSAVKDKELLKHISDGSAVSYDKLYGTNTQMPIQFKLWFISNNSMNIEADAGIFRRYRHMQMDSKFLSPEEGWTADNYETRVFKKDPNFGGDLRTKYRAAFLHLIFSYSKKFAETGMANQPADWKAEKEAVMQGNDLFKDWFETKCAVGGGLRVSKQTMEEQLKTVKKFNLRDELKRMRVAFTYESQERMTVNGARHKGVYHGFGMIVEEEGDPEA